MKTKQKYLLISFSLVFIALFSTYLITNNNVSSSSYKNHQKSLQLKPGDIIITKGPVLFGFFGHSSIAIDHQTVLQIEGPGNKPITESFTSYRNRFGTGKNEWVKVYRCVKPGAGLQAAHWAKENYENSNSRYLITLNLTSKKFTYCTKIIYQAYKYGVSKNAVSDHALYIISPYALKDNFTDAYLLKLVKTY